MAQFAEASFLEPLKKKVVSALKRASVYCASMSHILVVHTHNPGTQGMETEVTWACSTARLASCVSCGERAFEELEVAPVAALPENLD